MDNLLGRDLNELLCEFLLEEDAVHLTLSQVVQVLINIAFFEDSVLLYEKSIAEQR